MAENLEESVRRAAGSVADPETGRPLSDLNQVQSVRVQDDAAEISIAVTSWSLPLADELRDQISAAVTAQHSNLVVDIEFTTLDRPPARLGQIGLRARSVIAVGSGKGGVGKSTIAAALALTLERMGAKVGLMDADVYGPSVPHLLGLKGRPMVDENKKIIPILHNDSMPVISMGFLVEPDQAVIWRGPMLHGSITQFLRDTEWGALDYLIIDMPPGTGDVALTLSQVVPLSGAVVVCTPQEVALLDAVKAISMFKKVEIPVLGVVENMSGFTCPDCGKRYDIFGAGGAREKAQELSLPFLGSVPINIALRTGGDSGTLDATCRDPHVAPALEAVTRSVVSSLAAAKRRAKSTPQLPTL